MNKHPKNDMYLHDELTKKEVCKLDVLAIQAEMEMEQLLEWRNKRQTVQSREIHTNPM
jgi:hypothetical protein